MFRAFIASIDLPAKAQAMRLLHSVWLTKAIRHGARPPRIPVRRVSEGGWSTLIETPEGRAWADEFWQSTLDHPDAQ